MFSNLWNMLFGEPHPIHREKGLATRLKLARSRQRKIMVREMAKGIKLTAYMALRCYDIHNASSRVSELIAGGVPVNKSWINDGKGARVIEYSIDAKHRPLLKKKGWL